ncbi:gliding motility-associated C-terminal domain-containing protein [Emticicia sp. BO119]|uniref:T9SS type B sorting domain-containing protein n=1 Tax=Emticicia sp. BO119 TaxID=2757768 RepID=UPI0015F03F0C|nr:gliding motility-associated C-terminal domain-containing protein [Emticicia sp. BO119]MBA4851658.1 gliding motility-associated C-terminal domain-containing protein [Emticicia sp. BO119]
MKGIYHTILLCFFFPLLTFSQGNDQCIGPNIGTGALFTQETVGCVPFTVVVEKTDDNSNDHQYVFNYKGGPPTNTVKEKTYTYTQPGAYKLMQISFRKDNGQELRICAVITVLDTARIEISSKICDNTVNLNLSDIRKNGTIPYDYCFINWGDGSMLEKVYLPTVPVSHTYANKTDKKISVTGGYIVEDCGGTNSINLKFPVINEPKIQELIKTSTNKFAISFNNETGDDYAILANGQVLLSQKGKLGQTQILFDNQNSNACYSIQLQNACFTNTTSKEVCDINFKLNPTAEGNELTWTKPMPESFKDVKLTKNNSVQITVNNTSYMDNEIVCNEENCYQVSYTSNGSIYISEKLCVKNNMFLCETGIPIHIPTAFSPNGDGKNDELILFGDLEKFISLKIFNRRGHVVKLINYPYEAWSGDEQPAGLYEYLLKIKNNTNKEITLQGTITLIK